MNNEGWLLCCGFTRGAHDAMPSRRLHELSLGLCLGSDIEHLSISVQDEGQMVTGYFYISGKTDWCGTSLCLQGTSPCEDVGA